MPILLLISLMRNFLNIGLEAVVEGLVTWFTQAYTHGLLVTRCIKRNPYNEMTQYIEHFKQQILGRMVSITPDVLGRSSMGRAGKALKIYRATHRAHIEPGWIRKNYLIYSFILIIFRVFLMYTIFVK